MHRQVLEMEMLEEIKRIEALLEKAKADGKVGMVLFYEAQLGELSGSDPYSRNILSRDKARFQKAESALWCM